MSAIFLCLIILVTLSHFWLHRFIVVRLRKGERYQTIEAVAKSFREFVIEKPLFLTAMQDPKDLSDIRFQCLVKCRMSPSMKYLTSRRSPNFFSQHVRLREGQALEIRFRGNLTASDGGSRRFVYYYLHSIQTEIKVTVVDQYAQRTLPTYCGFLQIFTPRVKPIDDPLYPQVKYKNMSLLGEFCLSLPRVNVHPFQPILKSPLEIKLEGKNACILFKKNFIVYTCYYHFSKKSYIK